MKRDLRQVFGYTDLDLFDLRKGYLNQNLYIHWRNHFALLMIEILLIISMIFVEIYVFLIGFFFGIVMAVFSILILLWVINDVRKIRYDLRTKTVNMLSDHFRTMGNFSGPCYLVDSYRRRYRITQLQHFSLTGLFGQAEGDCTVYFLPRSRRVVAVEC
jgi:hypothetical protein